MHIPFLLYLLTLGGVFAAGIRSPLLRLGPLLIAVFLLIWIDFVLTAQLLSLFSVLNSMAVYVATSLSLAVVLSASLRAVALDHELQFAKFSNPLSEPASRAILWFLLVTGGLALLINLVLAWGLLPANPDSIVYRFPRAYWYLGHGALTHFSNAADPRVLYYPFNSTLLYLPLVLFQLDPRAFSLPSLACWLLVALTTYHFARNLGGPRLFAAATAWLICLTPNVLLQALSTNDDILAATAMLGGVFFVHRWFVGRQTFDAVLGLVGVGLSAGAKLHATFYGPLLIGIVALLAVHHRAGLRDLGNRCCARGLAALVLAFCLSAVMAFSFIIYNYISSGELTAWAFNDQVLNKPFSWHTGIQTAVLYVSQIVLTPLADLHVVFTPAMRAQHYEAFNRLFAPLFEWVDNGPAFTSASYRFSGVNSLSASVFNEHTIFIGFSWLVFIMAGGWLSATRRPKMTWARFHLASLPIWVLTIAALTRYIDGFSVYLGYAAIVAAPTLVFAFAPVRRPALDAARWSLLAALAATHCFFAGSIFMSSSPRNLIALMRSPDWPASRGVAIDASVENEIARSGTGLVNRSITWQQPFWATMMRHPEIPQFLAVTRDMQPLPANAAADFDSVQLRQSRHGIMPGRNDRRLHLFLFPQSPAYGQVLAVRIPDKASPGLTWIGDMRFSFGPEWVFAAGNDVEQRHPGRDRYVLVKYFEGRHAGHGANSFIRVNPEIFGLGEKDDLSFRIQLLIDGKPTQVSEWMRAPRFDMLMPASDQAGAVLMLEVRNDNAGGTFYSTSVHLGDSRPIWLLGSSK